MLKNFLKSIALLLASGPAFSQSSSQSTDEAIRACASGSDRSFDADLIGSVTDVYTSGRVEGTYNDVTVTQLIALLEAVAETDRIEVIRFYFECLGDRLGNEPQGQFTTATWSSSSPIPVIGGVDCPCVASVDNDLSRIADGAQRFSMRNDCPRSSTVLTQATLLLQRSPRQFRETSTGRITDVIPQNLGVPPLPQELPQEQNFDAQLRNQIPGVLQQFIEIYDVEESFAYSRMSPNQTVRFETPEHLLRGASSPNAAALNIALHTVVCGER